MTATPKLAHVVATIECTACHAKQVVHVRAVKTGFGSIADQGVQCIKCKKQFYVLVPDEIIDGPFPA